MMPRGNELLLPANPLFIWFSLFLAAALNMLPWSITTLRVKGSGAS
jgi:rod shape-determining protein MreD